MASKDFNVFELPVHPQADIYPMLPPDELAQIVADMETNGFDPRYPIVLGNVDGVPYLIDGRNRLAASAEADVKPVTTMLDDDEDIVAFIARSNIGRRNMNKGQQAMAMAMHYPEPVKYKQGGHSLKIKESGINEGYLSMARQILSHSKPLARLVLAGGESLTKAHEQVKQEQSTRQEEWAKKQLSRLSSDYPKLYEQVQTEELALKEAALVADERDRQARENRRAQAKIIRDLCTASSLIFNGEKSARSNANYLKKHAEEFNDDSALSVGEVRDAIKKIQLNANILLGEIEND